MTNVIAGDKAINALVEQCGVTEESKGFRDSWHLAAELERISADDANMNQGDARTLEEAAQELRNMYVSTKLMLVVTELAEAMEGLRDHGADKIHDSNFGEELADSHIRLFALAELLGFGDQGRDITEKMGVNTKRPYLHGRKVI